MAILGENEILYLKTETAYLPIGCLTSHAFAESVDMLDTTAQNDGGWETSIPLRQRADISFSGLVTAEGVSSTMVTFLDLRNRKRRRDKVEWKISRADGYADYGEGYITNISESAEVESLITFDGSIKVYGSPNNEFYVFYNRYFDFVTSAGGVIENEVCLKQEISKLI